MGTATSAGSEFSYSAFISHASEDFEKADQIRASLEERGFRCFIAPRDLRAGHEYPDEIVRGIINSRCLVVLLSEAANQSPMVAKEVERAIHRRKPVFPIRLEEVVPSPSLELLISSTHWIDAWAGSLVEHVDRLARDLGDESVIAQHARASKKVARRRQLPKWVAAGAGFFALVAAIVIGNQLSSRFTREPEPIVGKTPPPGPEIPHSPPIIAGASAEQVMAEKLQRLGIDPVKVTAADFKPAIRAERSWMNVVVEMSDAMQQALAGASVYYAIGDGSFRRTLARSDLRLQDADVAALSSGDEFKLKYQLSGVPTTLGPFSYKLDPSGVVREKYKALAKDRAPWLTHTANFLHFHSLGEIFPAVKRIHFGEVAEKLDRTIDVEQPPTLGDQQAIRELAPKYQLQYIPLRAGATSIFAQLEYYDGTRSEVKAVPLKDAYPREMEGMVFSASSPPAGSNPPLLFVNYGAAGYPDKLQFVPDCARSVELLRYSFGDGGFYQIDRSGFNRGDKTFFSFEGPLETEKVRLVMKGKDGKEIGPFTYETTAAAGLPLMRPRRRSSTTCATRSCASGSTSRCPSPRLWTCRRS